MNCFDFHNTLTKYYLFMHILTKYIFIHLVVLILPFPDFGYQQKCRIQVQYIKISVFPYGSNKLLEIKIIKKCPSRNMKCLEMNLRECVQDSSTQSYKTSPREIFKGSNKDF